MIDGGVDRRKVMADNTAFCAACGGDLRLFGTRSNYEYHRCSACGTIQLFPLPDEAELAKFYASQYVAAGHYEGDPDLWKASSRTYNQSIIQVLKDYGISGIIVDYGAGWGGLCQMLIENGFQCQGLEISTDMVAYCQERGLPVQRGDLEALEEAGGRVSALVLCAVFEHLVNHGAWLARAHRLLKDDGFLVSLQPTAPFANLAGKLFRLGNRHKPLPRLHQVFCPPWHIAFFSLDGMRILASRNRFELLEIRPAPQGRMNGLMGIAQICLELINRVGWSLVGSRWPLLIAHIFVLRKARDLGPDPP